VISPVSRYALLTAIAAVVLGGCSVKTGAPVIDRAPDARAAGAKPGTAAKPAPRPADARPEFHIVRKGDTLYSIALDYGLDYRELAQWNDVTATSIISIGQQLRLSPQAVAAPTAVPLKSAPVVQGRPLEGSPVAEGDGGIKSQPRAVRAPYSDQTYAQMASLKPEVLPRDEPRAPSGPAGEESVVRTTHSARTSSAAPRARSSISAKPPSRRASRAARRVISMELLCPDDVGKSRDYHKIQ